MSDMKGLGIRLQINLVCELGLKETAHLSVGVRASSLNFDVLKSDVRSCWRTTTQDSTVPFREVDLKVNLLADPPVR